jgi:hypothetical protein
MRDDERNGAGFDVVILQDGELSFSRRCAGEAGARFVADTMKQDHLKSGWKCTGASASGSSASSIRIGRGRTTTATVPACCVLAATRRNRPICLTGGR